MNSPRGDVLLAVLLVIAGHLGVIARALTGAPFFGLMGLAAFAVAAAVLIGTFVGQIRAGFNEPHQPPARRTEGRVGEDARPAADTPSIEEVQADAEAEPAAA